MLPSPFGARISIDSSRIELCYLWRTTLLVDASQKIRGAGAGHDGAHGEKGQITGDRTDVTVMKIHIPKGSAKMSKREKLGTNPDRSRKLAQRGERA